MARPEIHVLPDGQFEVVTSATLTERWSWALYDFANTIFSMNIITLYFPVWIATDLAAGTGGYALASSVSAALVALSVPLFGTISDDRRRRKPWVVGFTLACIAATAALGVIGTRHGAGGAVLPALLVFALANYAFQAALPFYNAMMPELVPAGQQGRLSGYGTALGYVGSIAGVLLISPFFNGTLASVVKLPDGVLRVLRQIPFTGVPGRPATFVPSALMFLLFAIPFFLFCHDHLPLPRQAWPRLSLARPFRELWRSLVDTQHHPGLLRFVLTTYFYRDAMGTIIAFMAIYAVTVMGFKQGAEVTLFVVLTIPSIFGAMIAGWLSDRFGPKRTLMGVLLAWMVLLVAIVSAQNATQFWAVGALIGLVFGGVATAERPMLLTLVPDSEGGRYFGLLVLSARVAAVIGPLLWALIVDLVFRNAGPAVSYRVAIGTLALMMGVAAWLLRGVPDRPRGGLVRPA